MDYAKILQQSAGKSDYRESPLKTLMKVNELRKTINKDGRANIIRQEPYANRIQTYLSNEELKSKMNLGAIAYKQSVQSVYDNYQLEKLKNDPIKYIEKARKQTELMKLFSNPSQLEYLKKTDPIGLFYLEQSQDEQKQRDLEEEQEQRQQEQQRQQQAQQQQEEIRQRAVREATVRPLADYEKHLKGPKVTFDGNSALINGERESNKNFVVSKLSKFDPTLNESMTLRQIVEQYNRNRLKQASELSGLPSKAIQGYIDRQHNEELIKRRLNQGTAATGQGPIFGSLFDDPIVRQKNIDLLNTAEGPDFGSLFDEEKPIVQQHAQELMAENPALDANEAVKQAQENVVDARPVAQELEAQEQYEKEAPIPLGSSWMAEGEDVPSTGPLRELELIPSSKILNKIVTKDTLEKIATRFRVPYNDTDSVDTIRQKLKNFRKLQKRMETFGAKRAELSEFTPLPEPTEEEELFFAPSSPAASGDQPYVMSEEDFKRLGNFITTDFVNPLILEIDKNRAAQINHSKKLQKYEDLRNSILDAFNGYTANLGEKQKERIYSEIFVKPIEIINREIRKLMPEEEPLAAAPASPVQEKVHAYGMTEKQLRSLAKEKGITFNELMYQLFDEQLEREHKENIKNITREDIEKLERLKKLSEVTDVDLHDDDDDETVFRKVTQGTEKSTLENVLVGRFGRDFVDKYLNDEAAAAPSPAKVMSKKDWQDLGKSKGVEKIKGTMGETAVKRLAKEQGIDLDKGFTPKGSGFRPLSSYHPHIIAGALHIVKQRKKLRTNQNEYNREQAHHLIQKAIHGEGFFGDLKDKIGMWLFKNVHPMGRMIEYVKNK